jgi:hypothetical protein
MQPGIKDSAKAKHRVSISHETIKIKNLYYQTTGHIATA